MRWYGMSPDQEAEFAQLYKSMAYPHKVLKFAKKVNPTLSEERFWECWSHMNFIVAPLDIARKAFINMVNPQFWRIPPKGSK